MIEIKISKIFYSLKQKDIEAIIEAFNMSNEYMGNPNRNLIKKVCYKEMNLNVKAFKLPNILNQFVYGYVRNSKALRSFEYANRLLSLGIGTPKPLAYFQRKNILGLRESYYISEQLDYDLTYRELVTESDYPFHEDILRAFTRFTFYLHEKGVYFLDHSPGNTLILKKDNDYHFFLVDLNRMKFQHMEFYDRMKNFARLTPKKEMVEIMSDEYAKISGHKYDSVFSEMWQLTQDFQEKFRRKRKIKQKLLLKK